MNSRPRITALTGGLMGNDRPPLESIAQIADVTEADTPGQLATAIRDADALFVWDYRFAELAPLLASCSNLSWIHAASVGVDPLLSAELKSSGITLTNSRGVFDAAIAEYVIGLLLAHYKDFRSTLQRQASRTWDHRITERLAAKSVAVVGTGSIGREIARSLRLLGVSVELVGRRPGQDAEFTRIVGVDALRECAARSDALVLAVPLTEGTRSLVDAGVLEALGPAGYLINVARGAVVNTEHLVRALTCGSIAGAALDVFDEEPLCPESPLWAMENVFVSPHMSADFKGFEAALVEVFRKNLVRWTAGDPLSNVIDQELGYVRS